jgi:hypothetical protein
MGKEKTMRNYFRHACATGVACLCGLAMALPEISEAGVDSFRIRQLASSQDGGSQIIELEDTWLVDIAAGRWWPTPNRHTLLVRYLAPVQAPTMRRRKQSRSNARVARICCR